MAPRQESKRQWVCALAVVLTAVVCLFGFSQLAPEATFVIALAAFVAIIVFFWLAGKNGNA